MTLMRMKGRVTLCSLEAAQSHLHLESENEPETGPDKARDRRKRQERVLNLGNLIVLSETLDKSLMFVGQAFKTMVHK